MEEKNTRSADRRTVLKAAAGASAFSLMSQSALADDGKVDRLLPDLKLRNTTEQTHTFSVTARLLDGTPEAVFSETVELAPGQTEVFQQVFTTPATSEITVILDNGESITRDTSALTALPRIYGLDAAVKPDLFAVYKRHVDSPEVTA